MSNGGRNSAQPSGRDRLAFGGWQPCRVWMPAGVNGLPRQHNGHGDNRAPDSRQRDLHRQRPPRTATTPAASVALS